MNIRLDEKRALVTGGNSGIGAAIVAALAEAGAKVAIYPLRIRGLAMSMATSANWGANLLVALTFLSLVQLVGRAPTFWLYAAVGVGAWFFAWFFVPETRGQRLEDIEAHWQAGRHPRAMELPPG